MLGGSATSRRLALSKDSIRIGLVVTVVGGLVVALIWKLWGDALANGVLAVGPGLVRAPARIGALLSTPIAAPAWLWCLLACTLLWLGLFAIAAWLNSLPSEDADDLEKLLSQLDEPQRKIMRALRHADGQPLKGSRVREIASTTNLELTQIVDGLLKLRLVSVHRSEYEETKISLTDRGVRFVLWWERRPVLD